MRPWLSPATPVAAPGSVTGRVAPDADTSVTTDRPPGLGPSTTSDFVAASNTAACARSSRGYTTPAGAPATGGETAASAGTIVGGGESIDFAEQPADTAIASA